MKNISKCKVGAGIFFACLLAFTQVIAAPKNQEEPEPPLGTWVQQGEDLNGDGILSGDESDITLIYSLADTVHFTLHVEGGCVVSAITCSRSIDGSPTHCSQVNPDYWVGFNMREAHSSPAYFGLACHTECTDECKFTVTDVRP